MRAPLLPIWITLSSMIALPACGDKNSGTTDTGAAADADTDTDADTDADADADTDADTDADADADCTAADLEFIVGMATADGQCTTCPNDVELSVAGAIRNPCEVPISIRMDSSCLWSVAEVTNSDTAEVFTIERACDDVEINREIPAGGIIAEDELGGTLEAGGYQVVVTFNDPGNHGAHKTIVVE